MRRVGRGLLVGICAWSLSAPAVAQDGAAPVPPADAPVVASLPGAALVAFDRGTELCVGLRGEGPASCDAPPHGIGDPLVEGTTVGRQQVLYGATTADAVSVEVLQPGKRDVGAVSGGAYVGRFAGQVRFFLVAISGRPYRVLVRDAQGRVVAGTDFGPAPRIGHPVEVRRGTLGGKRWRATVSQSTHLMPTPLDRGRVEPMTCVDIAFGREDGPGSACSTADGNREAVSAAPREHCDPNGLLISGLVGEDVRRIDAVLGDGTLRRVPLEPLPARFGDPRRAYVLVVEPGKAVRALRIAAGGRVRTLTLGQAPGGAKCHVQLQNGVSFAIGGYFTPHPTRIGPLVARDDGDRLCVGLDTIVEDDCQLPPIDPRVPRLEIRRTGKQTALLAVVPPEIAALRLTLDRGGPITAATTDLPAYAGRYAGLVRAADVALPAGAHVYAVDELAPDGQVAAHVPGPDLIPLPRTPTVLARLPGGVVAAASGPCVQVSARAPTRDRAECGTSGLLPIFLSVPCAARRVVIVARIVSSNSRLRVRTDHGVVRVRRKGRFAIAIVGPRDSVREVQLTGTSRASVRLPPAARQCGYELQT